MKASIIATALLIAPILAQAPTQLKHELRVKETAAKKDADALFAAGKWASEKGLATEAKRIYQAVLKLKPEHEGANTALGNELFDGKWMPAKDAEVLRKKALAAEYTAKGFVEVSGVWVEKDKVADAKRGVFEHEGQAVTREEKIALLAGKVRHPDTGELIDARNLEKAQQHYYPIGAEGRWVDEKEADNYHSDGGRPWIIRSTHCTVASTLPIAKLQVIKQQADRAVEKVQPLLGMRLPQPAYRPVIVIGATESEFRDLGNDIGDETSAYGGFLADKTISVPNQGEVRPGVCNWHKDWGPYYLRHAAGLAYAYGVAKDAGLQMPLWMLHGFGSVASRFENESDAGFFGKQHLEKGGVKNLKSFFATFAINGEMENKAIDYNVYQAGLVLHFAMQGGDPATTEAMQAVTSAVQPDKAGDFDKALARLTSTLVAKEAEIKGHMDKLITKAP
jgi:hypothetical protein